MQAGGGGEVNYKKTSTGKMATTGNVKPLSTRERMSLFFEHSGEGKSVAATVTTPKVVIKRDAKFKAACNKLKWFNKGSGPVEQSVSKSIAGDSSKIEDSFEDDGQFYSFHEKVDPSIDEAVNPPVKLPTVLLVSRALSVCAYIRACVRACIRVRVCVHTCMCVFV